MISRSRFPATRGSRRFIAALGFLSVFATGCTDWAGYDLDYILGSVPFLSTMRRSVAYEAQQMPRTPAPNTVPVASGTGEILPPFGQAQLDSVGAALTNPFTSTPAMLARGEQLYQTHCFVCHGEGGQGNGPVVGPGKFPMGPTLVGGTALGRSAGYVYGVIRVGRGLMPAYGDRISHNDRWAVVAYVQQLQQQ